MTAVTALSLAAGPASAAIPGTLSLQDSTAEGLGLPASFAAVLLAIQEEVGSGFAPASVIIESLPALAKTNLDNGAIDVRMSDLAKTEMDKSATEELGDDNGSDAIQAILSQINAQGTPPQPLSASYMPPEPQNIESPESQNIEWKDSQEASIAAMQDVSLPQPGLVNTTVIANPQGKSGSRFDNSEQATKTPIDSFALSSVPKPVSKSTVLNTVSKDILEIGNQEPNFEPPTISAPGIHATHTQRQNSPHTEVTKLDIPVPVHSPNWSAEVGQRVVWMAKNDVQEAQLSVNPPHLGPIEITLSLKDDNASARFSSPYPEVRAALEEALPRLREMLAGAGVQLGQSDVGSQSQQAFQQFAQKNGRSGADEPTFGEEHPSLQAANAVNPAVSARSLKGNGLVDMFV